MQNTANYQLPTWEKDDQIKMSDFNAMTAKLDAALKSNADAVASEAAARQTAVSAEAAARGALAKNLGAAGHNARVAWGSYSGTGASGAASPNALTFDFCPVLVAVAPGSPDMRDRVYIFQRPRTVETSPYAGTASPTEIHVSWTDSGVSWYVTTGKPTHQLNSGTYYYVVLGYDKAAEDA